MRCLGLRLKWEGLKRGWKKVAVERERCGPGCCGREGLKVLPLASSAVVLLQIKSSMFHSAAISRGGEGHGYMSAWGWGGSYHCFFSSPA